MTDKPRKLIIGCTEKSKFQDNIQEAIEKCFEGNPLKLFQDNVDDLFHWVDMCDGVILAGGVDVHPRTYGKEVYNNYNFSGFDVKRDVRELRIIRRCFKQNIPIFGICRGHQMLGIHHKIPFLPDISDSLVCHQPQAQKISHAKEEPMHWVRLTTLAQKQEYEVHDPLAEEFFYKPPNSAKDRRYLYVNSFHHQALLMPPTNQLHTLHQNIQVLGFADGPGKHFIIEMMSGKQQRFLSTQWHPEYDWETNPASRMVFEKFKKMMRADKPKPV